AFLYNSFFGLGDENEVVYDRYDKLCIIGNDVWIGCNATILRGVCIGDGAVVAANAVVSKDDPPSAIVGRVPAKILKYRFSEDVIAGLLDIKWWDFPSSEIKKNSSVFSQKMTLETLKELKSIKNNL